MDVPVIFGKFGDVLAVIGVLLTFPGLTWLLHEQFPALRKRVEGGRPAIRRDNRDPKLHVAKTD